MRFGPWLGLFGAMLALGLLIGGWPSLSLVGIGIAVGGIGTAAGCALLDMRKDQGR